MNNCRQLISGILVTSILTFSLTAYAADRQVIQNKGSDTLDNVAQAWAEAYREVDDSVAVAVFGGGSGTGIAAMINGTVDIANASRKMKGREMKSAQHKGQDPLERVAGHHAWAVFMHKDNPAESMSISQLKETYGAGSIYQYEDDVNFSSLHIIVIVA